MSSRHSSHPLKVPALRPRGVAALVESTAELSLCCRIRHDVAPRNDLRGALKKTVDAPWPPPSVGRIHATLPLDPSTFPNSQNSGAGRH